MDAAHYFSKLNDESQEVFASSIENCNFLGLVHDLAASLYDWKCVIVNAPENQLLEHCCEQLEMSCLSLLTGQYRQAYSDLRLSIEMLFGFVYFSAHRLEYVEWTLGSRDLNWRTINGEESGVLSVRFSKAFLPEAQYYVTDAFGRANCLYRRLSEFTHGNYATWDILQPSIKKNQTFIDLYSELIPEVRYLFMLALAIRFLKVLDQDALSKIEHHILDELNTLTEIRRLLGGPVEMDNA